MKEEYKKTELGEIPIDWEIRKLGDITDLITKGTTPTTYGFNFVEEGINFIKVENITESGKIAKSSCSKITEECHEKLSRSKIEEEDILLSIAGSLGRSTIINKEVLPANTNQALAIIRIKNKDYCVEYVNKTFSGNYFKNYIDKISTIGAQPNLSLKQIANFEVLIPTLQEQKKIASILSTVDEQIENTEKLIDKTKELKKGLMQTLLTKGIGHTEFKKTEVGEIPVDWEVKYLGEVAEFKNGKAHEKNICELGEYIVINSKFVSTEGKEKKYSNENICPLNEGDIVMVMSDVPNGRAIAKCYLVEVDNLYTLNQRICSLTTKSMNKIFLFYYLNRNKYFLKYDDGVKQTNLRREEVVGCPVLRPPLSEQKKIASILSSVDEQMENYESKKEKLEELKKGLMQQLLTGKIRVKV